MGPMRLRLVRSTSRRRGINWFNCCQPAVTATTPGSSTAAAGCLEPGIELANSIHGSGWFYSGYSGFHPPFLKRFSELIKRDKKRKELKRLKILKLTTENKTFFQISFRKQK